MFNYPYSPYCKRQVVSNSKGKSTVSNGVDSLIAIEFRTWLAKEAGTELSLIDVTVGSSINELSQKVAYLSRFVQGNISEPK
ncbi:conserved hypothetical protein [Histoplasma capsulatum H143]|uniref:Carrier domain-containing protein n=1 Tax=Ajellomyces capsulatus (strain H143) TaxID=544712 RepID=C6H1H4_AJECH|nr:conserved hypothetical protein [Histoplasma capsulatum H143]